MRKHRVDKKAFGSNFRAGVSFPINESGTTRKIRSIRNLKAPQPEGGPRKRSFCARMSGVKGPMKDSKGRPTRKALALRKWKC